MLAAASGAAILPLTWPVGAGAASAKPASLAVGRGLPLDEGWRFYRGSADGFENPALDDSGWRRVDLPHDWSIEDIPGGATGPFDAKAVGGTATGFTVGGEGWYRRSFSADNLPPGFEIEIVFDGAYLESDVWLNGHHLGRHVEGYTAFAYDLTPYLNRDGANSLAVRVRNSGRNSRWYSGSGLYRSVALNIFAGKSRVAPNGVGAWTRKIEGSRSEIDVTTQLVATGGAQQLVTRLLDVDGNIVAEARSSAAASLTQTLVLPNARLWAPGDPYLYTLETLLLEGGAVLDRLHQPFGVRIVAFNAAQGMSINGKPIKLRGGCLHHDNGLLGACAYPDADERRIRLLQARGFNAIRSAHNIASSSLRGACDRLGMLLVEEAFDAWHVAKEPQDFAVSFEENWSAVLEAGVLAARNSPSVIMWSIGNEIPGRSRPKGVEWQWRLANKVRSLDPTRPVTAGLNGVLGPEMTASAASAVAGRAGLRDNASTIFLDISGYNYRLFDIESEHAAHPERIVYCSETFATEAWDYAQLSQRAPYFLGEFLWAAMDYLGEAGVGMSEARKPDAGFMSAAYPWVNAWCGDIDLIGNQKAASRYRDVVWGLSALELAVQKPLAPGLVEKTTLWGWSDEMQSWTWPGAEGRPVAIRLYTPGDRVEVRLNGVLAGTKRLAPTDKMRAELEIPYAPGVLEAIAFKGETEIGRKRLSTVGAAAKLHMASEKSHSASGRQRLHYVGLEIRDAAGRAVLGDQRKITLAIDGPAELIGFGSANPRAAGSYQALTTETFQGRALAILRARGTGRVRVEARTPGLAGAAAILRLG
ncbi:sugar-binding domain-containing protein [Sphingopyxis sp. MSC1_008]|uniref:sugar-binding domain-containing protein n=1 Tax=Sphingopyxis sp. MSC1_008 TaxID=2909265 RepID=UPI0020BF8BAD|nr:sugar-binding domain-containing protein [Sphingopyxis sp. MSC1_008]